LTRAIPSTGEQIPVVGLGSWITFNVGDDPEGLANVEAVIAAFLGAGGAMIDSSPMYGSAQAAIGAALQRLERPPVFSADKVWTSGDGPAQIETSRERWNIARFDLLQVHNLVALEKQFEVLQAMKAAGRVRYVGITTSEGRRHREFEDAMRRFPLDFVQFSYNPVDREAEERLLPLARERGQAVIINRPFQQGALTQRLEGVPLPGWAAEGGARTWAQAILRFVLAHPAVTCVIPATSKAAHAVENVEAARLALPDTAWRERLARELRAL
jgi:diketogulonate reductase-like aldo/keto reductase